MSCRSPRLLKQELLQGRRASDSTVLKPAYHCNNLRMSIKTDAVYTSSDHDINFSNDKFTNVRQQLASMRCCRLIRSIYLILVVVLVVEIHYSGSSGHSKTIVNAGCL